MRSVVESLRLNCPRHERVDIHVSLSPAFASTDTSLLSLFCSLNLLKCMLKDSSAFFDLRACPSHKTDTVGTLPSAGSSAPHSLVIRAEAMHSEICISANVNYDWALSLSTRYYLLSVVHPIFMASSQTRKFWRESHVLWAAGTWFVWRGADLSAFPRIFSSATPSRRVTSLCPPLLHHQHGT